MKYCVIFSVLLLSIFGKSLGNNWEPCGADWEPYKDEKCFQILENDHPTQSFESAIEKCTSLEDMSTLVMIQSDEEQEFVSNFLFKTHRKVDNFWIGAKYSSNSFKWLDNSEMRFTNWRSNYPRKRVANNSCVQMQAEEDGLIGKWKNEPCEKRNAVVCQKMQFWSIERLQKSHFKARYEISAYKNDANKKIQELKQRLDEAEKRPVPVGFIYVQLSNQPEPRTLWPAVQWEDVTSEYAGLFFRAEGGGAAQFGTVQAENSPRVTQVSYVYYKSDQGAGWIQTNLTVGAWSTGLGVFAGSYNGHDGILHKFFQSGGEVRPRNMAMRVWKRVN